MKREDVDTFEKLMAQLNGLHQELSLLVKKSPNDAMNKFKLNFINNVLHQFNVLLGEKNRPFADFEVFSVDEIPSTSDVTFIISQYIECAEKFRADNIEQGYLNYWYWKTNAERIRTAPPKKLSR